MPWQCGREAALRSSRAGRRPALGHLRARSLPPGRTSTRSTRTRPTREAAKGGKQPELRRRRRGPRRHRRRGDRKGSAISETPRSGPQAVKDARSARLVEPLLDGRGPGRTGAPGGLRGGPCPGPSAASRRAALALDKARPFGPGSAMRRCSCISSVRSSSRRSRRRREGGRKRKPRRPRWQTLFACETSGAEDVRREGPRDFFL